MKFTLMFTIYSISVLITQVCKIKSFEGGIHFMRLLTGWIIYNGNLPNKSFYDFANWLHVAAKRRSIDSKIYQNNHLLTLVAADSLKLLNEHTDSLPDFRSEERRVGKECRV